jgi:hypothetical protein
MPLCDVLAANKSRNGSFIAAYRKLLSYLLAVSAYLRREPAMLAIAGATVIDPNSNASHTQGI